MGLEIPGKITGKKLHKYAGGTYCWYDYLMKKNRLEPLDYNKSYPIGTLLISNYINQENQGHVAIITSFSTNGVFYSNCIHSYYTIPIKYSKTGKLYPGCIEDKYVAQSAFWYKDGTYTHVCLPENWILLN